MPFARLLAAALAAVAVPGAVGPTIHAEALRGGAKAHVEIESSMALTLEMTSGGEAQQAIEWPGELKLRCTASVTKADEAGPTEATLQFGRVDRREKDALTLPAATKQPRTSNARYELTRGDAGFEAKGARGDLDHEERETTAAIAALVLGVPPLGQFLEGRSPRSGERMEVPLEVGRRILPLLDVSIALESMRLVGEGTSKHGGLEVLAFGLGASLVSAPGEDMEASIELTGELLLRPTDGQIVKMSLTGPVKTSATFEEDGATVELKGKGTWKFEYAARFE